MKRGLKVDSEQRFVGWRLVTTVTPMKRGLKVDSEQRFVGWRLVTTVTPMKRGLKENYPTYRFLVSRCYNRYPDEKGTESLIIPSQCFDRSRVTTVTPMKRGLKVNP